MMRLSFALIPALTVLVTGCDGSSEKSSAAKQPEGATKAAFKKYQASSQSAEAKVNLRMILNGARVYYMNPPQASLEPVAPQFPGLVEEVGLEARLSREEVGEDFAQRSARGGHLPHTAGRRVEERGQGDGHQGHGFGPIGHSHQSAHAETCRTRGRMAGRFVQLSPRSALACNVPDVVPK